MENVTWKTGKLWWQINIKMVLREGSVEDARWIEVA
jgi:hypothetical protein